jgi:4-amino-4-deoxy-L-arabinose transferase-like glycosyltransferase
MSDVPARLSWKDYALLSLFCWVLFSFPLFNNRVLTTHETVHCQNVREMIAGGDWLIPHYGGRVWMERPPLPFWITAGFVEVLGDKPAAYRLPPLIMGWWCVLLVAWMASVWYGRGIGVAAGLILATMREFTHYSTGAEADMFLCAIVTSALALFVRLEFLDRPADAESTAFLGKRPWPVLAFFLVLALTNFAKGLFFGSIFVCLPVAIFLLWNGNWSAIRRYVWLPGWLAYALVGFAWAAAAYWQYPDVIDFWRHDYGGRVNQGYMREPAWYYFAQWPWVVFPWPLLVVFGSAATWREALRVKGSAERFLWCWGLVPISFFSALEGKHHHYLLQTMAPWAVLGALGAVRFWEVLARSRDWLRRPWAGTALLGLPIAVALMIFRNKVPGPAWLAPALAGLGLAGATLLWWALMQKHYLRGLAAVCLLLIGVHWGAYALRTAYWDRYREDTDFVRDSARLVPARERLLVMDDDAPLNASWLLFYLGGRARLLHNITFLRAGDIAEDEVYLITRRKQEAALSQYGTFATLLESQRSRYEDGPEDRYALYRLHFHPGLERVRGPVPISPLQATGRADGPYLH